VVVLLKNAHVASRLWPSLSPLRHDSVAMKPALSILWWLYLVWFCHCHHYGWWQLPSVLESPWVGISCWVGVSCCRHCSCQPQITFFIKTTPMKRHWLHAASWSMQSSFLPNLRIDRSSRQQVCSSKPFSNGIDAWSGGVIATQYTVTSLLSKWSTTVIILCTRTTLYYYLTAVCFFSFFIRQMTVS